MEDKMTDQDPFFTFQLEKTRWIGWTSKESYPDIFTYNEKLVKKWDNLSATYFQMYIYIFIADGGVFKKIYNCTVKNDMSRLHWNTEFFI